MTHQEFEESIKKIKAYLEETHGDYPSVDMSRYGDSATVLLYILLKDHPYFENL